MTRGLVLLIEDDRYQQRLYTRALESAGFTVVAGDRGEQAPRLCDLNGPKLVILDVNLPGITGIEACRLIRKQYSMTVPVIFVTSNDQIDVMREGIEAGGDDFMVKGGVIQGYLERVGYWMRRRCLTPEERAAILKKVGGRKPAPEAGATPSASPPSSGVDAAAVAQMSAFLAEAKAGAPATFGTQASEKMVLLGYAAGVVNALANSNLDVKARFAPHLRALLTETGLLTPTEIEVSVGRWHTMYRIPVFSEACQAGEQAYGWRLAGADSAPTPMQSLLPSA